MGHKLLLLISFSCLISSSCSQRSIIANKENTNITLIDIDKAKEVKTMFFSSYFEPPTTIVLETNGQCIIQNIQAIEIFNNNIYILDDESNACYVFNENGSFVKSIGKIGNGHGEYLELSDFSIDRDNGIIYLWDEALDAAHAYNIETGDFLSSIKIGRDGERSFCLQYANNKLYINRTSVSDDDERFILKEIDVTDAKQKASYLNAQYYNKGWNYPLRLPHTFFYSKNYPEPKYVELFSDTIVSITEDGIIPSYVIKSKDFVNDEDIRKIKKKMKSPLDYDFSYLNSRNRVSHISRFSEWKHHIYLQYTKGNQAYNLIFDNRDNSAQISTSFIDDYIAKDLNVPVNICYSDNDGVLAFIAPFHMEYFVSHYVRERKCKLELEHNSKITHLDDNANPILFYHKYKE